MSIQARRPVSRLVDQELLQEHRLFAPKIIIAVGRLTTPVVIGLKKLDPHCFVLEIKLQSHSKSECDLILDSGVVRDAIYILRFGTDEMSGAESVKYLTDIEILARLIMARMGAHYCAN
jgi:hypothetical protein